VAVRISWEDQEGNIQSATISIFTWGHIRAPQNTNTVFYLDTDDGRTATVRPCEMKSTMEISRD
jgi:hypothetical protein